MSTTPLQDSLTVPAEPKSSVVAAMLAKQAAPVSPEQAEIAALKAQLAKANALLNTPPQEPPAVKQFPKYIMPLSNCNICLPNGKRIFTSDGVIIADSFMLEEYLESMVEAGNCFRFVEGDATTSFQTHVTK